TCERHSWQAGVVGSAVLAGERIVDDHRSVLGGDIDELVVPGHVPGSPDPPVRRLELVGDDDLSGLAGVDPAGVEVESFGDWATAGGHQHPVGSELLLGAGDVRRRDDPATGRVVDHGGDLGGSNYLDAFVGEHVLQ